MLNSPHAGLAFLICSYTLFEFLAQRILLANRWMPFRAIFLLVIMLAGTSGWFSVLQAGAVVAFVLVYAACDAARSVLQRKAPHRTLETFLAKQLTCALSLLVVWGTTMQASPHEWFGSMLATLAAFTGREAHAVHWSMVAAIVSAYLFNVDGGTKVVRGILDKFPGLYGAVTEKLDAGTGANNSDNAGEWIGVLERLIALTFVLTGNLTALAFALTAKSIARFKELEDKQFSEYYILGTSASLIVALFTGMAIRLLFVF